MQGESQHMELARKHVEKHGTDGIEEYFKAQPEKWRDVEINIGVTGDSGVGKSSLINALRGVNDDDEGAAETGVKETTLKPAKYPHPTNSKIKFWDLPGIGTPNSPNLATYCEKAELKKYDTFLILTAKRFNENDRLLAEKVKSLNKSFFFIRTHIDVDYESERSKKAFKEETMLNDIRKDCLKNLEGLRGGDEDVFLISNHHLAKWDFARLTKAILDGLQFRQVECLTLSLHLFTSFSKDILKKKIEILRDRILMVAAASSFCAVDPVDGLSIKVDLDLLTKEVNLYKSQLGLPKENSTEFKRMSIQNQEKVRKFCSTHKVPITDLLVHYGASSTPDHEERTRYIPVLGKVIAESISFSTTHHFLNQCLKDMEGAALESLDEMRRRVVDNLDTILLKDIFKQKIEELRGRIWMVAAASSVGAAVPVPALSIAVDTALLTYEANFYQSELRLPEENLYEFQPTTPENQKKLRKFCFIFPERIRNLLASFAVEEAVRYIPFLGSGIAGGISFISTYYFLRQCLDEMEEKALK